METSGTEYALLRDGGQVLLRAYQPEDLPLVHDLFVRLSPESWALRFHTAGFFSPVKAAEYATAGFPIVAEQGGRIVALASYVPLRDPTWAEMAIVVDDAVQGKGVGTAVFERLARDAWRQGIRGFIAAVLERNRQMKTMLEGLGFQLGRRIDPDAVEYLVDLKQSSAYQESADSRRHVAAASSLEPLFSPKNVAIIGASRRPGTIGHEVFRNMLNAGFGGTLYPVNPNASSVCGVRAYSAVTELPTPIDLGVIMVPAAAVQQAAEQCLDAGARALVVLSAGFAEAGQTGRERQTALLNLCRDRGARLVGPNCLGILVHTADGTLNATFAPKLPPTGGIAFASQSGALGIAILERAKQLGVGISSFVSMGNKADLSSNDLLERWEDDPHVQQIVLYLESFGNPRRFSRIASRVGRRKPIVVVKGGRSASGKRAAASHTAALAGSDVGVEALFRQAGVIRCDTLEELFEVATLLGNQPLPSGNRVAILTNAGGLGILCADACESNGLVVPQLSESTRTALAAMLPPEASVNNPVDMLASVPAERYTDALRTVLADPEVDSAIVLFIPPLVTEAADVAAAMMRACDPAPTKPVLASFVGAEGVPDLLRGATTVPSFRFPEAAARALGHAAQYRAWLRRPAGHLPEFADLDEARARAIIDGALAKQVSGAWLNPQEAAGLLGAYGVRIVSGEVAKTPEDAAARYARLGGPAAVKLVSRTILHKSDVGGVRLDISSAEQAADAFRAIQQSVADHGLASEFEGVLVQPMITGGVECLVGAVADPTFGHLLAFGLGGVTAEVIGDVRFRLQPLTDRDADELIAASKAAKLLAGFRGAPPGDTEALRDLLLRVSRLLEDVPEIAELDINPVIVRGIGDGVVALDARVMVRRV